MRCEDIQKQLAINTQLSQLPDSIRAHLIKCSSCRQAQALYAGIERELREQPVWQPPSGFTERVGLQGLALLDGMSKPQFTSGGAAPSAAAKFLSSLLLGFLAATFSLLVLYNSNALAASFRQLVALYSRSLLANAIPLAWTAAILSLWFAAWLTRRVLRQQ
jgi:hypothetical protein